MPSNNEMKELTKPATGRMAWPSLRISVLGRLERSRHGSMGV